MTLAPPFFLARAPQPEPGGRFGLSVVDPPKIGIAAMPKLRGRVVRRVGTRIGYAGSSLALRGELWIFCNMSSVKSRGFCSTHLFLAI
jgi:hypothetical protein